MAKLRFTHKKKRPKTTRSLPPHNQITKPKPKTSKSNIQNLPTEIKQDILSRLPIHSVFQTKSVCQSWLSITNDSHFNKDHYTHASQNPNPTSLILFSSWESPNVYYIPDFNRFDKPIKLTNLLPLQKSGSKPFRLIGSCNGFLCLVKQHRYRRFYVCNPVSGDYVRLPKSPTSGPVTDICVGFGYSERTKEYKVVKVYQNSMVDVFTLGTESWVSVNAGLQVISQVKPIENEGCFANGKLSWLMLDSTRRSCAVNVISFNVEDERFEEIGVPQSIKRRNGKKCVDFGVLGGCLMIVYTLVRRAVCKVWLLKCDGKKESWVLEFEIPKPPPKHRRKRSLQPVGVQRDGKLVVLYNCKDLFSYDPNSKQFVPLRAPRFKSACKAEPHVGTFVTLEDVAARKEV